jgi:hypothetical protein
LDDAAGLLLRIHYENRLKNTKAPSQAFSESQFLQLAAC